MMNGRFPDRRSFQPRSSFLLGTGHLPREARSSCAKEARSEEDAR